jgi:hypothetical protein
VVNPNRKEARMVDVKLLTLGGLADGAAEELFAAALTEVLANIEDPNTDPKAKRRITLAFDFAAEDDRRMGNVTVTCAKKLAGVKGVKIGVVFGRHLGAPAVVEQPSQDDLFKTPQGGPRPIAAGSAEGGPRP